jgi:hypothetical protein
MVGRRSKKQQQQEQVAQLTPEELEYLLLKQEMFFEPCKTKEELQQFLLLFLKLDLPDHSVDELSTSTPMDFIWEVYHTMLTNEGPFRHAAAAARGTAKTLVSATIEFLSMIHFRRDTVHTSALKQQSKKALKYMNKFCNIDVLRQYFKTESTFELELVNLPKNTYTTKNDARLVSVASTIQGVNGERSNCLVFDELDLVSRDVISEAAMQQTPTLCGNMFEPVTIYLSSRKTNDGPVQDIIEEAEAGSTSIRLHKYSMVDWMQKCPESVHGPHGLKFWVNSDNLKIHFDELPETEQPSSYVERVGYENCRTCPALVVCQGRSANQESTSKFLKSRQFVGSQIQDVKDPKKIIAQLLNWRPESTGIVFSSFSRTVHSGNADRVYSWMFGTDQVPENTNKDSIYKRAMEEGWQCVFGIDWGYYDPAVVVVVLYHKKTDRCVVLHVRSATSHANNKWAESVIHFEAKRFPPHMICPDMADAASHTYFQSARLPVRNKKPMRIETGVSQVRGLMFDPSTQQSKFMILNADDQSEWAIQSLLKWRHSTTVTGAVDFSAFEDDEWTHAPDSIRYALDIFIKKHQVSFATAQVSPKQEALSRSVADSGVEEYQKQYARLLSTQHGLSNPFQNYGITNPAAVALNPEYVEDPLQAKKRARRSGNMAIKF